MPPLGAKGWIELHAEAAVDLDLILVIDPTAPGKWSPFRLTDPFDQGAFGIGGVLGDDAADVFQNSPCGLMELRLTSVTALRLLQGRGQASRRSGTMLFILLRRMAGMTNFCARSTAEKL